MGIKMDAYNELLLEHLNYYSAIAARIEDGSMTFLLYSQLYGNYNERVEDIMKHYICTYPSLTTSDLLKINIIANADAAKSAKKYFKDEDDDSIPTDPIIIFNPVDVLSENVTELVGEDTKASAKIVTEPCITKVRLMHMFKMVYANYYDVINHNSRENIEIYKDKLSQDLNDTIARAVSQGMSEEEAKVILKESKEIWGKDV